MDVQDDGNTTPISRAVFSTEKLESLGWRPLFSIDDGLRHTIEAMR
jgi:nucleoside-diphosphate-sugar epimerase